MVLVAVMIGYIMGIAPFIYKEIKENIKTEKGQKKNKQEEITIEQIIDEYLNGPINQENKINQEDLYQEYITGKEATKGE